MTDLDELEKLLREATQEKWQAQEDMQWAFSNERGAPVGECYGSSDNGKVAKRNAALICAMHEALPSLIADARRYRELIYAVAQKFPNETRHQTALRYIDQRESGQQCSGPTEAAMKDGK